MAEAMTEMQLMFQEKQNTGTAWTKNKKFEVNLLGRKSLKKRTDNGSAYEPKLPTDIIKCNTYNNGNELPDESCSICLEDFKTGDNIKKLNMTKKLKNL